MHANANNVKSDKLNETAASNLQQGLGEGVAQFMDMQSSSFRHGTLANLAENSPSSIQLKALSGKADRSPIIQRFAKLPNPEEELIQGKFTGQAIQRMETSNEAVQSNAMSSAPLQRKKINDAPVQRVELELEGETSMWSAMMKSTFAQLKEAVDQFNATQDEKEQYALKNNIIRLCDLWLERNATDVSDRNKQKKEISVRNIRTRLQGLPTPEGAEEPDPDAADERQADVSAEDIASVGGVPTEKSQGMVSSMASAASSAVANAFATDPVEKNEDNTYKAGTVGKMQNQVRNFVMNIQDEEGTIRRIDKYIQGDAAVNAYFARAIAETDDPEKQIEINTFAKKVLTAKFQGTVMKNNRLQDGNIFGYKDSSLAQARQSESWASAAAAHRMVVEMYYNQLEKMQEAPEETEEARKKAVDIYQFASKRSAETTKIKNRSNEVMNHLVSEGRMNSMFMQNVSYAGTAFASAITQYLTMGFFSIAAQTDMRGFITDTDFTIDTTTGEAEKVKSKDGEFKYVSVLSTLRGIKAEFDSKMAQRKGMGKTPRTLSILSLGLEGIRQFLGLVQIMLQSLSGWSAALATVAAPMVAVSTFLAGLAQYVGMMKSSVAVFKAILDICVDYFNTNPALFAELNGERTQSIATASAAASTYANRADINTDQQTATMAAAGVTGGVNAAAIGATSLSTRITNNYTMHSPAVSENQKIKPGTEGGSLIAAPEEELIREAAQTTAEKAKKQGSAFITVARQVAGITAPNPPLPEATPEDLEKKEATKTMGNIANETASEAAAATEDTLADLG